MKKRAVAVLAAACLLLSGCSSLLERSYSSVEPYTDRYWASGERDILKAESYQDLVNLLLMLVEQRSEEGVIRYYVPEGESGTLQVALAKHEVCSETLVGTYYLESLVVSVSESENYYTLTWTMKYREGVQDIASVMALSDSESLVDLIRLALREGHPSLTAQFISKVSRSEVEEVVNQLWIDMYLAELEAQIPEDTDDPENTDAPENTDNPENTDTSEPGGENGEEPQNGEDAEDLLNESGEKPSENGEEGSSGEGGESGEGEEPGDDPTEDPPEPVIEIPPCPWVIVFYPNTVNAEIVEIRLK